MVTLVPWLQACVDPNADTRAMPSAYVYTPEELDDAVDPAEMQVELQALFDNLRTFNGATTQLAYAQARAYGDELCPSEVVSDSETDGHTVYFNGTCVADGRYWFKGPMTTYAYSHSNLAGFEVYDINPFRVDNGTDWYGTATKGQTDIYDEDSDLDFNCSCTAMVGQSGPGDATSRWLSWVDGTSHWVAPEAEDSWINEGIRARLWMYSAQNTGDPHWEVDINGSVTGYTSMYGTIDFDLKLGGSRGGDDGFTCDKHWGGTVSLRHTTTGLRTDLTFATDGLGCTVCAPVEDSSVCLDLSSLEGWETAPW